MVNLKLDADNDLDLSTGGLELITGTDEIVQKLVTRLQFFLGEWFLDARQGIPYFEDVLVKNPDLVVIQGIFREAILETPGVAALLGVIETTVDRALRILSVSFTAQLESGDVVEFNREFLIGD